LYLIKNISRGELALGDLRLSLRPGQQQDLDMIASRYVSEQSNCLRVAIKTGRIKIIKKDGGIADIPKSKPRKVIRKNKTTIVEVSTPRDDEAILGEIKQLEKRMAERQDILVRKHLKGETGESKINPEQVEALNAAIAALQGITGGFVPKEEEFHLADDQAVKIQEKTIERLTKEAKGTISHEEKITKSNVDSQIDELEELL